MSGRGVVVVAVGPRANEAAHGLLGSLVPYVYPVTLVTDRPQEFPDVETRCPTDSSWGARESKLSLFVDPPYDLILYLDADTEVLRDPSPLFTPLEDGWHVVVAPSTWQDEDVLQHVDRVDREETVTALGTGSVLQLQAGVVAYRRCPEVKALAEAWLDEWRHYGKHDQGALLRALYERPVRVWIVGHAFNGGNVVAHHWGRARGRQ